MKLVYYAPDGHHKNSHGISLMCAARGIECEHINSPERLHQYDYDILVAATRYVDPSTVPSHIKIIMGPQYWVFPSGPVVGPYNSSNEGRLVYNGLSLWIKDAFLEMAGSLRMPIVQFPYAVDVEQFKPVNKQIIFDCLVYHKQRSYAVTDTIIKMLHEKGITYCRLDYGSYNETEYVQLLQQCKFMICVDRHESQGFALEEAMACNTPLLVLDAPSMYDEMADGVSVTYEYCRPKKLLSTSVPYWSDTCGIKITDVAEFPTALDTMLRTYDSFTPRDYVLKTLAPAVCMDRILDYFGLTV